MPVWKIRPLHGWIIMAARTRKEAFQYLKYQTNLIGVLSVEECECSRVKNTFHSGNKVKVLVA